MAIEITKAIHLRGEYRSRTDDLLHAMHKNSIFLYFLILKFTSKYMKNSTFTTK